MIKQFFKKVLISYLIIICCIYTPTYRAYAASPAGWAFNSYDVATSVVTALKGSASASVAVAKSPISAKIAKGIVGGAIAGAALPLAISQITGIALTAVDWVLDPANNAVKYKDDSAPAIGANDGNVYCYNVGFGGGLPARQVCGNARTVCNAIAVSNSDDPAAVGSLAFIANNHYQCNSIAVYDLIGQPSADYPPVGDNWKSIPIATVADKIYDNAKTDPASASIVNDAVRDYVNEGSADVALDNAKADTDASHACGTGTHWNGSACVADTPSTPSTPTTPDTPFDPTSIIDAINSVFNAITDLFDAVMSIPDVINTAIDDLLVDIKDFFQPVIDTFTDFVDWVKKDPELPPDDNTPFVKDDNQPGFNIDDYANKPYVQFSGECPAPPVFNVFGGQIVFPMDIICKGCEQMSWVFVAFAWLRAVMIVFFASKG